MANWCDIMHVFGSGHFSRVCHQLLNYLSVLINGSIDHIDCVCSRYWDAQDTLQSSSIRHFSLANV